MGTLIKADIFFFITSISVIFLTCLFVVALFYIIRILKDIKHISSLAKAESDIISEELSELRANIRTKGAEAKHFFNFFKQVHKKSKKVVKKVS